MISCNTSNYPYSDAETEQFLNEVAKNAKASITDITEIERKPSDKFGIITKYPLGKTEIEEYNRNNGTIVNKDDNIEDFLIYQIKKYELKNEKNEVIDFVYDGKSKSLQSLPLSEYNNVLYKNLGVTFTVHLKFEKLNGFIDIEFQMLDGAKKEVKIPVNISIHDKVSE